MTNIFGPDRQSIRLRNFDYASTGVYSVTLCTQDRSLLFGEIRNAMMRLSSWGEMVQRAWQQIPQFDSRISLDEFVVMPNHLHGIILIDRDLGREFHCGRGWDPAPTISLQTIVGRFKSWTTYQYKMSGKKGGWTPRHRRLWQRNYYEHIVRGDAELNRIREYIRANPANWETDPPHPPLELA